MITKKQYIFLKSCILKSKENIKENEEIIPIPFLYPTDICKFVIEYYDIEFPFKENFFDNMSSNEVKKTVTNFLRGIELDKYFKCDTSLHSKQTDKAILLRNSVYFFVSPIGEEAIEERDDYESQKNREETAVILATKANELSETANYYSKESNRISSEANTLSNEANLLACEANRISKESNSISNGANELAENANEISNKANLIASEANAKAKHSNVISIIALVFSGLAFITGIGTLIVEIIKLASSN